MLLDDLNVTIENKEVEIIIDTDVPDIEVALDIFPDVIILGSGNMGPQGPPGPQGQWISLTQAEYDALDPPDPETLYVIIE